VKLESSDLVPTGCVRPRRRDRYAGSVVFGGLLALLLAILFPLSVVAETVHKVYLKGTNSELDVYFIRGRTPGRTLLLVGGIQGNEPGGYLAADLYADISLRKGNMIVVPRANFLSIIRDSRGVRGDMNRKFAGRPGTSDQDVSVVRIIKGLMRRSDFFLNLHDGSGFYSDDWHSPVRNPMRYGQSIIVDAEKYGRRDGRVLSLGAIARRVIDRVNPQIADGRYLFHFNNHRTREKDTRHKEQRLSATFHALTRVGIPAFGIETSKGIPDYRLRVRYQTMVINAFLDEFGIVRENPKIFLDNPRLKYLVVSINDRTPIVVTGNDVLEVQKGDRLRIVHIESNYTRGLTAGIKGSEGRLNYLGREIPATEDTVIEIRKDRFLIATLPVEIIRNRSAPKSSGVHFEPRVSYFCVRVNDKTYMVEPGNEIRVIRGDRLVILDPKTNLAPEMEKRMRIDLRGFQATSSPYPVEDRGHLIRTEKDLQPKYGQPRGTATLFRLQAKLNRKVFGQCLLSVVDPRLKYVVVRGSQGADFVVYPDDRLEVPAGETIRLIDIRTNALRSEPLFITMAGRTVRWQADGSTGIDSSNLRGAEVPLDITRQGRSIGRIRIKPGTEYRITSLRSRVQSPIVPAQHTDSAE
jgi:predicted deacylase